uniref:Tyrosinase copper-binding domain-containing protein n=1 Tax=Meloidogyne hapla TaxID=6305 RepID=A0A1I8B1K7_MELHA
MLMKQNLIISTNFIFQLIFFCLSPLFLVGDDRRDDRKDDRRDLDREETIFCQNLPHSNYLSAEDILNACLRRNQWLRDKNEGNKLSKQPTASQKAYFEWLESRRKNLKKKMPELETENFVKRSKRRDQFSSFSLKEEESERYLRQDQRKYRKGKKFIRKEYRMMTDLERKQLQLALNALKQKHIDNVSIWDLHTLVHYPNSAVAAHWGPAFLPWHREFLRQFEITLQNEQPGLPDPSDSVLWSEELMGNGNGFVKSGPFKDWDTNVLMPLSPVPIQRLYRSTGGRSQDRLMSPKDVEWITTRNNFSQLTFCHDKTFESMHGLSHVWVGGFMFVIRVSPNDPTFYLHHAFIDFLWEQFRLQNQDRHQRENDYAIKNCNRNHEFNAQMKPFNLRNKDGLSNDYTDFWFEYEPIRHCSRELPFCDSKFLFCDKSAWRCRSKIILGGNCTGFVGTEICYQSICIQNVCRLPATEGNGFLRRERRFENVVWAKTLMLTEGSNGMSSGIAHVTGLLYLPLPNPKEANADFNVSLEASDHYGRYCQSYCLNATTDKYQVCVPQLVLRSALISKTPTSNISFTHQLSARKFLDMDLSVHPKHWKVHSPFIVFNCQRKLLNSAMVKEITERLSPPIEHQIPTHVWFRVGLISKAGSSQLFDSEELQIEAEEIGHPFELFSTSLRRARSVFDQGILFLRASNPFLQKERSATVKVSIRRRGQRMECDALCDRSQGNSLTSKNYCDSTVRLHTEPELSEDVFATDLSYMPYLGWRMIGHASEWRFQMPFLTLSC